MVTVRCVQPHDAKDLSLRLGDCDLREIQAVSGDHPLDALHRCILESVECYTALDRSGRPAAIFGVAPDSADVDTGIIWLLGSDALRTERYAFLRSCPYWVQKFHRRYAVLWNYIDARNTQHMRWLAWCGFNFVERLESYGFEGRPFWRFVRNRPSRAAENSLAHFAAGRQETECV